MRTLRFLSASAAFCFLAFPAAVMPALAGSEKPAASASAPDGQAGTEKPEAADKAGKSEKTGEADKADKKAPVPFRADNPHRQDVYDRAKALAKELNGRQSLALAYIKNGYGTIRAVELVEKNIKLAVDACGTKNPEIKDEMDGSFKAWQDEVHPVLATNREAMDKALNGGTFKDVAKIRAYLAAVDKAASYADAQMEKNILSTPDSCEALMDSMDDTQDTLADLLKDIPWTPPADAEIPGEKTGDKSGAAGSDAMKAAEDAALKAAKSGESIVKTEQNTSAPDKPADKPAEAAAPAADAAVTEEPKTP